MARRRARKLSSIKVPACELSFRFDVTQVDDGFQYIDIAQCLSKVNRKLYRQGKVYYVDKVTWLADVTGNDKAKISLITLPNNWVCKNAYTKSYHLWRDMQKNVLEDNPSVQGKWADYKVYFDQAHFSGGTVPAGPNLNLDPMDASGVAVLDGEWSMSTFVAPQHDVDPATGIELAADEYQAHMLGDTLGSSGAFTSVGIILGYQDTRAQVQAEPLVPADMSASWMTELTDVGGQDPELAQVIEDQNDNAPYSMVSYPGVTANFDGGILKTQLACTSASAVIWSQLNYPVPLGLLKVNIGQIGGAGQKGTLIIDLVPGDYSGTMATDM
jgi:hypothetical protein